MKVHLNLSTTDLNRSIAFYSTLLDAKPVKTLADYALFITENPGLELALDLDDNVPAAAGVHYGVCVENSDLVERAIERLEQADLAGAAEREETCCYANQTKVWATDPEGRRWEIYTVHEETAHRIDDDAACCT